MCGPPLPCAASCAGDPFPLGRIATLRHECGGTQAARRTVKIRQKPVAVTLESEAEGGWREAAPPDLPRALASKVSHGRSFPAVRRELYSNEYNMLYVLWILGRLVKKLLLSDFRMTDIH